MAAQTHLVLREEDVVKVVFILFYRGFMFSLFFYELLSKKEKQWFRVCLNVTPSDDILTFCSWLASSWRIVT